MARYSTLDPIAALATPWGESAIAVIRTSGKKSLSILGNLFRGKTSLQTAKGNTLCYGFIVDPVTRDRIDEVLVAVYKAPKSYTGEDSAEILCHGSLAILRKLLSLFTNNGFRQAGPGEFTMRAFLNNKMDLTRAEAVNEIVRARSDKAREAALNRLSGSVEARINLLKQKIKGILAKVELLLDYPEDEIDEETDFDPDAAEIEKMTENLLSTYNTGKIIQEGITVVIAGSTNAGKSTLFNLLLREDRSIVSDIHGTTRDFIEGFVTIEEISIRLFDTAGIRPTNHPIEVESMKRTDRIVKNAQVILYIVDAGRGLSAEDELFIESRSQKPNIVLVWNKIDANPGNSPAGFIPLSAKDGIGLDLLLKEILKCTFDNTTIRSGEPIIDSLRQKELLERCLSALRDFRKGQDGRMPLDVTAICLNDALNALGEITGEVTSQDVLESIFSQFCVGK
jgi:tRNA modification GTPase